MRIAKPFVAGVIAVTAAFVLGASSTSAADARPVHRVLDEKPVDLMLRYFQGLAKDRPSRPVPPRDVKEWEERRAKIRQSVRGSMGDFPFDDRPALRPKITGTIDGGNIVIEKVLYESLPGLYVTALLYRPKLVTEPLPSVLYLNGHWADAKFSDHIQTCCQSVAKLGMVAFCQDVIGTGERAAPAGSPHMTYHGIYRGGVAQIAGRSLFGYEMFECIRAVDYLTSRSEVDPKRILCTGASGGGMQSMYLPALDDRLAAAVPVCYISSYQAHIGATACVGEVQNGVLNYTNQWELLGMHAPRPLLCIAATKDVSWFQPALAEEAIRRTRAEIYRLYDREHDANVVTVDAPHDYNKEMRELMYRFADVHVHGGTGAKIMEPAPVVRTREELTVGLPASTETIASLTFQSAIRKVQRISVPRTAAEWDRSKQQIVDNLRARVFPVEIDRSVARRKRIRTLDDSPYKVEHWTIESEPGVVVPCVLCEPTSNSVGRAGVIIVDEQGKEHAFGRGLVDELVRAGNVVLAIDCRGMGETAGTVPVYETENLGMEDYNLANYSLTLGRPLAGMLADDIRCAVDFLETRAIDPKRIALAARGRGALAGLFASIVDERISAVVLEELLATYRFPGEFKGIGLTYLVPDILGAGDVEHLAACLAPRRVMMINPVSARRESLDSAAVAMSFPLAEVSYKISNRPENLERLQADSGEIPRRIAAWLSPK